VGKVVVAGVALGVAGCVLAISLFRGGVIATRAFYGPVIQVDLPFTSSDDYAAVVRKLGPPAAERWSSLPPYARQYELLAYPQRRLYVILMGRERPEARYIGAMDWNWHPAHAVDLSGNISSVGLLRRLPRF
jgi:hypothetical protein